MDFTNDRLADGRRFRMLNVGDDCWRETLAIDTAYLISRKSVCCVLERLVSERGLPQKIRVDDGVEFMSKALEKWASSRGVELIYLQPGRSLQKGYIESLKGKVCDE